MSGRTKQKKGRKKGGILGASHIPYAQRIAMQQQSAIAVNRNHSAKIAMFCLSVAMHELEGVGYKRLVHFSLKYKEIEDEFYEDPELGMAHAVRRMEQIGMPISGELYAVLAPGLTKKQQQIHDHALQAAQVSLICGAIAMNDVFGYGKERQERISKRAQELSDRYSREGEGWLLAELEKIGFLVVDGQVRAFLDDDNKAITPARAKKEGFPEASPC
jgi:hypothetical protein